MPNPGDLIKTYRASGAIGRRRLVKFAADGVVTVAIAATDRIVGISDQLDAADGALVDIIMSGSAEVVAGGAIAAGQSVTANAAGAAVAAAAGAGNVAIGYALSGAAAGDIIDVAIARHSVT